MARYTLRRLWRLIANLYSGLSVFESAILIRMATQTNRILPLQLGTFVPRLSSTTLALDLVRRNHMHSKKALVFIIGFPCTVMLFFILIACLWEYRIS